MNIINRVLLRLWCASPSLRYTAPVQKCTVCSNAKSEAVASPTDKRAFVTSNFWRWLNSEPSMVSGEMGLPARMAARLRTCYYHLAPQMPVVRQTVDSLPLPKEPRP